MQAWPTSPGVRKGDNGMVIDEFNGAYSFLSNFYPAPVTIWGHTFKNSEAAFQAAKCPERMEEFAGLEAGKAKRLGRQVQVRPDWESVKKQVMYDVVKAKFTQNKDLAELLLMTGEARLVEGNTWHDTTWGVHMGFGKNWLGEILMQVREELRQSQPSIE